MIPSPPIDAAAPAKYDPPQRPGRMLDGVGDHRDMPNMNQAIPIDARLLGMIVHDIRNPLNVIGLTLRVIEQMPSPVKSELQEDLGFLRENTAQITRMLVLVSEFCRLREHQISLSPAPIEPARFLGDLLAERAGKATEQAYPARLDCDPSTPATVHLEPVRLRFLIQYALANAAGATDRPLLVRLSGSGDRWRVTITVDRPPPSSVQGGPISSNVFERLMATEAERRSFELAIAAWLGEELGGSVRMEVNPGVSSTVVVDLPVRSG